LSVHGHNSIINNSHKAEINQGSTDGQMDKQNFIYTNNRILFNIKKKILVHDTISINIEVIMLDEINQLKTQILDDST
jgi:hypothetical protein